MAKFAVEICWSKYTRGNSIYEVEAETSKEARENWHKGKVTYNIVHHGETDKDVVKVTELKED